MSVAQSIARLMPESGRRAAPLAASAGMMQRLLMNQIAALGFAAHAATVLPAGDDGPPLNPQHFGVTIRSMGTLGLLMSRIDRVFAGDAAYLEQRENGDADPHGHFSDLAAAVLERNAGAAAAAKNADAPSERDREELRATIMKFVEANRASAEASAAPADRWEQPMPSDLETKSCDPGLNYGAVIGAEPLPAHSVPRKRGGQIGNRNALKTGSRTAAAKASRRNHRARIRAARTLEAAARCLLTAHAEETAQEAIPQKPTIECAQANEPGAVPPPAHDGLTSICYLRNAPCIGKRDGGRPAISRAETRIDGTGRVHKLDGRDGFRMGQGAGQNGAQPSRRPAVQPRRDRRAD